MSRQVLSRCSVHRSRHLSTCCQSPAEQGRLVRRRWIDGTTRAEGPLLEPDGVGVIADAAAMYSAVLSMRILPIGKASLGAILVPVIAPMLVLAALQIPMKTLLLGLLKTLI